MEEAERRVYENWFNYLDIELGCKYHSHIYLHCNPEVSYQRVTKRARSAETNLTLHYLTKIHQTHLKWLLSLPTHSLKIIDVN
jgi:deoxyadenosine/deoxycytidine kinase